ncbi:MAG: hypothetical protein HY322_06480 [Betaproteobacteria bacterium]|nr:hypothetical protein [Betaproteobacteria bacterium]
MFAQTDAIPLSVVGEPRDPAVAHYWMAVACCPSCGSTTRITEASLPDTLYAFGTERVAVPEQGVNVIECGDCGLFYKSMVPTPAYLADMIRRQGETKWTAPHYFRLEAMILKRLNRGKAFDLLDVGAAGGALLEACAASGVTERRAALDVMRYAGDLFKTALYFVTGAQYAGIAHVFGKQGNQPWYPFARDHFQACLVRE